MKNYYVYVHKRKGTDTIFYVGKGSKNIRGKERVTSHKNRNNWWKNIVDKDGGFDYEIIYDNLSEQTAFELEIKLINEIGIDNLVNLTEGGLGGNTLSNHPEIETIGKKISEANSGDKNGNYGKGYYYWWVKKYGKEIADEMKSKIVSKISAYNLGKKRPTGISNEERLRNKYGEDYIQKDLEIREKIRNFAKNRIRKIIKCEKCGREISHTHIKLHKCK